MYHHIPATGPHVKELTIDSPIDDYELLDFGGGCKLERFDPYMLDRGAQTAVEEIGYLSSFDHLI